MNTVTQAYIRKATPGDKLTAPNLYSHLRFLQYDLRYGMDCPCPTCAKWCDGHASMQIGILSLTLTLASVTLNSRRIYWGMLYSAIGSTTKYW
jgi:hypothetical protein